MIPSRPLNLFEITQETFRIFVKIFLRSLILVLIFVVPFVALVIWGESAALQSAGHLFETEKSVTDAGFTSMRNRVLQEIELQNPGTIARFRETLQAETPAAAGDSLVATPNAIDTTQEYTFNPTKSGIYRVLGDLSGNIFLVGVAMLLLALFASGAYAGIVELSARAFEERKVHFGPVLRSVFRRHLWYVFAYQLLVMFVLGFVPLLLRNWMLDAGSVAGTFLSFLISVAQIFLGIRLCMSIPAMVSEEMGIGSSIKRSWDLTANNWWRVLAISFAFAIGMFFLMVVLLILLSFLDLGKVVDLLRYLLFAPMLSIHRAIQAIIDMIIFAVEIYSLPVTILFIFLPIFTTVFYYDLRTRTDGPLSYEEPSPVTLT